MKLMDKVTVAAQVLAKQVGDELVILDLANGTYFGLDPVGARIWLLLTDNKTIKQVCDEMLVEYEATEETVEHDVMALLQTLVDRQLVSLAA